MPILISPVYDDQALVLELRQASRRTGVQSSPSFQLHQSCYKDFSFSVLQTDLSDMPERPRYPAASAAIHLTLRAAGVIINVILIAFLGRLTAVYHRTYPAAYVAVCFFPVQESLGHVCD